MRSTSATAALMSACAGSSPEVASGSASVNHVMRAPSPRLRAPPPSFRARPPEPFARPPKRRRVAARRASQRQPRVDQETAFGRAQLDIAAKTSEEGPCVPEPLAEADRPRGITRAVVPHDDVQPAFGASHGNPGARRGRNGPRVCERTLHREQHRELRLRSDRSERRVDVDVHNHPARRRLVQERRDLGVNEAFEWCRVVAVRVSCCRPGDPYVRAAGRGCAAPRARRARRRGRRPAAARTAPIRPARRQVSKPRSTSIVPPGLRSST